MNFLTTSILSAISTFIKLLSGLVINKIVAIYIGPAGIALIGQFQNFLGIITTIGNGAVNSGVTKYVAEYHEDEEKRNAVINTAFVITLSFSIIIGGIIFFGSSYLSEWIIKKKEYSSVFKLLGVVLVFISFNSVLLSIINGLKQIKLFIMVNISGSLFSLVITSLLTIKYALFGALLSTVLVQSLVFLIALPVSLKRTNITFAFKKTIEKVYYKRLFAFSLMSVVSIISVSVAQMSIRNHLINIFSIEQAGYWQSVWMISTMYLMILTTAFSTYYLPKLSELESVEELRKEILSGYKIILPFVFITATSIYFLRDFIISILFSSEFVEMRSLFFFQMIGDFFKMTSFVLAHLMIAKAMTKTFIITEIIFAISFYLLTYLFTHFNGLIGVTEAYAVNYLIYFFAMIYIFRDIWMKKK